MSHCPSCGRYVGPYEACPYCGARMTRRLSIRAVKLIAILLATVGLALLWSVSRHAEVPTVPIGRAGPTMNLATIRVEGRCTRSPTFDPDTGYLSFWITDDTGELRVSSYRAETETLLATGGVPGFGDRVSVVGTIRIRDDLRTLTINAPGELTISRAPPAASSIAQITPDRMYSRVRVRAQIRSLVEPYPGMTLLSLRDATGDIDVVLSEDAVALGGQTPTLTVGQSVSLTAAVGRYEDEPQLVLASPADLKIVDESVPIAPKRMVGDLARADVGSWVALCGVVADLTPFSEGVKLTLDDGTGTVAVLLWRDLHAALIGLLDDELPLGPGAELELQGKVTEYRGDLEVVPELPIDVRVLSAAAVAVRSTPSPPPATARPTETQAPSATPSPTESPTSTWEPTPIDVSSSASTPAPAVQLTSIGAIGPDQIGQELVVEGEVVDATSFSHGFRYTIDDGQGQIVLLMWHDVYDDCWDRAEIDLGARVRAQGELTAYEGELQIEPRFGGDVKAVTPAMVHAPRREIASLTGEDAGQWLTIEGEVARTEGISGGVKVFLRDEAPEGEIAVLLWNNVLERIPNNAGLGTPGSRVRVVGRVQIYRSNLEFVPALPNGVTVLDVP